MYLLTALTVLIQLPAVGMSIAPARYSQILNRYFPDKKISGPVVYMGPEVKKPGEYNFKPKMTAADLIQLAGGLTKASTAYAGEAAPQYPKEVWIYRPTKKEPDPQDPIHICKLDWKLPDGGASACTYPLNKNDLLIASTRERRK